MANQIVNSSPVCGASKVTTIKDCLDMPAFNAMYEADPATSSANSCEDKTLGTAWMKYIANDLIRCSGKAIDLNFFMSAFGATPRAVDAKWVYNRYSCDIDHNVYVQSTVTGVAGNTLQFQLLRANHASRGKTSYPAKGYSILDKENMRWYEITDVDVTTDWGHKVTVRAYNKDVVPQFFANKKYLVVPARMVGGYSCPQPTNAATTIGYVQKVAPFRIRRDWCVKIDLMRGYKDILRFVVKFNNEGKKIDAWDTYEAAIARENLQLAKNLLGFIGTPITNADMIAGLGATIDDVHTGFYGLLPQLKYGGGQQIDFDPAIGFDLDADLEPFILSQDAMKKSGRFLAKHGKNFKARLVNRTNKLIKQETGNEMFPAYARAGNTIRKLEVSGYDYLGFSVDFQEMGALSDSRLLGGEYFSNLAIFMSMDGATDKNGNSVNPLEFYQYGDTETGSYFETQVDKREITLCEEITGYAAESLMMAVHCPNLHLIANPYKAC